VDASREIGENNRYALDTLELTFGCGIIVRLPRTRIWELASAAPEDVAKAEVHPGGDGLYVLRRGYCVMSLGRFLLAR